MPPDPWRLHPHSPVFASLGSVLSGGGAMWDTPDEPLVHLSHDMPCPSCGHALHTYLACDDHCACESVRLPGSAA